ncbi:MAG: hypothetical protein ACMV0F_00775 [Trichlorobacter sp.]
MSILVSNNAGSKLSAGIDSVQTSISLTTGDGALFPSPVSGSYFYATISEGSTIEIVKVTARSGDNLTIIRGQDGTTGHSFTIAAKVEQRWNRLQIEEKILDYAKSSVVDLSQGQSVVIVNFSTARADDNYSVKLCFECPDDNPIFLQWMLKTKTAAGFTVTLSAPVDSTNYKMHYSIGNNS